MERKDKGGRLMQRVGSITAVIIYIKAFNGNSTLERMCIKHTATA